MTRHYGLTQRERLHLNLLQAADYKSLRYNEPARGIVIGIFISAMFWAIILAWWLL